MQNQISHKMCAKSAKKYFKYSTVYCTNMTNWNSWHIFEKKVYQESVVRGPDHNEFLDISHAKDSLHAILDDNGVL